MSSFAKYFIFLISVSLILNCGPKPRPPGTGREGTILPPPFDLKVKAASRKATLYWSIDRPANALISGYDIYLAEGSAVKDKEAWQNNPAGCLNSTPYPGDTDGDINRESFPIENLENGVTYLALVRTVGPDGRESGSSNVAGFTPLAKGVFVISANHEASDGGFDFESEAQVPGRDPRSDIYLYATKERVGFSAPYRLGGGLKKTKFVNSSIKAPAETIPIEKGEEIEIITSAGRAEIRVEDIIGKYPDISARVSYVFHPDRVH